MVEILSLAVLFEILILFVLLVPRVFREHIKSFKFSISLTGIKFEC